MQVPGSDTASAAAYALPVPPFYPPPQDPAYTAGPAPFAYAPPFPDAYDPRHVPATLPLTLATPPLATAPATNPHALRADPVPARPKKKSKYSAAQDAVILRMKKEGRSWTEISEAARCGNSIAARNRYQVLIGQQGGAAVVWEEQDAATLKAWLDEGEKTKWAYIANELGRARNKRVTPVACWLKVRELFLNDPGSFGIVIGCPPQRIDASAYQNLYRA